MAEAPVILPVRMTQRMCDSGTSLKRGEIGWAYDGSTCVLKIGTFDGQSFGQAPTIGAFTPGAGEGINIDNQNTISLKLSWSEVSN